MAVAPRRVHGDVLIPIFPQGARLQLVVFNGDRLGALAGSDVIEIPAAGADPRGPLHAFIETAGELTIPPDGTRYRLEDVELAAPLPRPGKIIGAPVNYVDHQQEMQQPTTIAGLGVFLKAPTSVLAPGGTILLPYTDQRTDQEAELGVVIGRTARHVPAERALEHVFGYTCALDITVRSGEDRSTRKSFDTFTPLGPCVTTADEVGDPGSLRLRGWVGGELRQDARTSDMIFGVPELIAYASSVMTLLPGDVLVTGTPAGVGPLAHGDQVIVEIERVGRLEVTVSSASAVPYASRPGQLRVNA
jgi:2-keto-4-pentenoate hydratase/2-oxohepta-3-ene-1,7-dioic acid hydratase in catechol pathway